MLGSPFSVVGKRPVWYQGRATMLPRVPLCKDCRTVSVHSPSGSADGGSPVPRLQRPRGVRDGTGVRRYGDPVLLTVAAEIREFARRRRRWLAICWTRFGAGRAGVAARRSACPARLLLQRRDRVGVVSSMLVGTEGEQYGDEGCLSVPELWFPTRRSWFAASRDSIRDGNQVRWKARVLARCLEHEVDHLDGVVYLRRLDPEFGARRCVRCVQRLFHACRLLCGRYAAMVKGRGRTRHIRQE